MPGSGGVTGGGEGVAQAQERTVTMQDIARALRRVAVDRVAGPQRQPSPSVPIAADDHGVRVLEIADRLGYRPNPLARGLRGAKTMLLGVIVREIADLFFTNAVEAVSIAARERNYNVVLGSAHSRADEAIALRAVLETRHCDGDHPARRHARPAPPARRSHRVARAGRRHVDRARRCDGVEHDQHRQPGRHRHRRSTISSRSDTARFGFIGELARTATSTSGSAGVRRPPHRARACPPRRDHIRRRRNEPWFRRRRLPPA